MERQVSFEVLYAYIGYFLLIEQQLLELLFMIDSLLNSRTSNSKSVVLFLVEKPGESFVRGDEYLAP